MTEERGRPHYFLGANTPQGFVVKTGQLLSGRDGERCFVIKGGPGSGKSTVINRFASEMEEAGRPVEYFHCSSDAESLDAVSVSDGRYVIIDGTPPHAVEPEFPGAYETLVPLGDCWDEGALRRCKEDIIGLFSENRRLHEQCRRFLSAAGALLGEVYRAALDCTSPEKISACARRICRKEFGPRGKAPGAERVRFLSAVTDRGIYVFNSTARALCDRLYVIDDEYGAASRLLMAALRRGALEAGKNVVTCYCTMFPYEKIEHLFIPELRLGFTVANKRHPAEGQRFRTIHARRFMDAERLSQKKMRIRFTLRAASELLSEAVRCMKEAKAAHDRLEACYIPHVDFGLVTKRADELLASLESGEER